MSDSIDQFFKEWDSQLGLSGLPKLPDDIQYIYRIARISKILGERLDATCNRLSLTRSQFEAMAVMRRRYPEPLCAGDLMSAALLTSGSVTAMLNQLLARGWVQRRANKEDKRRIEVQLTAAGKKIVEEAIHERIQDNTALARLLPKEQRTELNRVIKQLLSSLEALDDTDK